MVFDDLNNENIDNEKFLSFFINRSLSNVSFINRISFNKKSISINVSKSDKGFIFNEFFDEKYLFGMILRFLRIYVKENNLNLSDNLDIYEYKFKTLNVNYK